MPDAATPIVERVNATISDALQARRVELDARDIALHFGHRDGGELVRKLYGHPDAARARERRIREAYRQAPSGPTPIRKAS